MELPIGTLVGFGNPLLDISTCVKDNQLLVKYDLTENEAILAEEQHMPLFDELNMMENVKYSAGGSCQCSLRVFQWILGDKFRSVFFGAVGDDRFGERIAKRAKANGVETRYQIKEGKTTGTSAVIINGENHTIVAHLGAAELFDDEGMDSAESQCVIDRANIYYTTGFFLVVSSATVMRVAKYATETNRTMVFHLSASFVFMTHMQQLLDTIPFVDILLSNKLEALGFAEAQDWKTQDLYEIGKNMQSMPKASLRSRIVIITDEANPVLVFTDEGRVREYLVPPIDEQKVVDSSGCGDAFVGGFLAQYCQRMPMDFCIRAAIWSAQQIMQVEGVMVEKLRIFNESCI